MKKHRLLTLGAMMLVVGAGLVFSEYSDQDIRKMIIRESIASYSGSCPCPYNLARNGSRCGGRSAYSRPGGYETICYESDISDDMVAAYRKKLERK